MGLWATSKKKIPSSQSLSALEYPVIKSPKNSTLQIK